MLHPQCNKVTEVIFFYCIYSNAIFSPLIFMCFSVSSSKPLGEKNHYIFINLCPLSLSLCMCECRDSLVPSLDLCKVCTVKNNIMIQILFRKNKNTKNKVITLQTEVGTLLNL